MKSFLTTIFLFAASYSPALAQDTGCAEHASAVNQLLSKYGEVRQSIGLAHNNSLVEVFASEEGTWSILVTSPNGISCLVASGDSYESIRTPKKPSGEPL